jgi:hypothetical protein
MFKEENVSEIHEIIDLEEYAKAEKAVPASKSYKIRIDKEHYKVGPEMTGKQLLETAGKNPYTNYAIYEKLRNGQSRKIGYEETVSFRKPGIERFYTIPLDPQDGRENLRKEYTLSESDTQFLDSLGLKWELVGENNINRVIIYDYPAPDGYNVEKVDLHLRIEAGYPDQAIDMFYVFPHLSKKNSRSINNLSSAKFDGKNWQQWSRHRTGNNPWRPGFDDINTHMSLVNEILLKELER